MNMLPNFSDIITGVALFFTFVTILSLLYTFFIQSPILKLELILSVLSILLAVTEVIFGTLQLIPCCQKVQYY